MLASLDDLASDFSVFHGIRDIGAMAPGAFLRLAARIGAYGGAVTWRAQRPSAPPQSPGGQRSPQRSRSAPEARLTPRTAANMPVASTEQLRAMLAKVPGSDTWGEVRTVKPEQT